MFKCKIPILYKICLIKSLYSDKQTYCIRNYILLILLNVPLSIITNVSHVMILKNYFHLTENMPLTKCNLYVKEENTTISSIFPTPRLLLMQVFFTSVVSDANADFKN